MRIFFRPLIKHFFIIPSLVSLCVMFSPNERIFLLFAKTKKKFTLERSENLFYLHRFYECGTIHFKTIFHRRSCELIKSMCTFVPEKHFFSVSVGKQASATPRGRARPLISGKFIHSTSLSARSKFV